MTENKKKPHDEMMQKDLAKTIAQHIAAWALLIALTMWLWSMIKPVMPMFEGMATQKESSETVAMPQAGNAVKASTNTVSSVSPTVTTLPKASKPATTPTTVAPPPATTTTTKLQPATTTTTMFPRATTNTTMFPGVVNGARATNPLISNGTQRVKIIVNGLNVRDNPSSDGSVVGGLKKNEQVTVLGYQGEWIFIKTDQNLTGFIKASPKYEAPVK